jgi:Na+/melibiose symporter-like transporter
MLAMQQKLSNTFLAILALPASGLGFALSVQISALSWILTTQYGLDIHDIGLVWAAGPIAGIFGQVIIGAWSDRVWVWGGRRRPFILVGGTIAALTLLALPNIDVISGALGLDGILGIALIVVLSLDFAINVGFNPTRSIIADVTPAGVDRTRGYTWMQGVSGSFGVLAYAIGAIWDNYVLIYVAVVIVLLFNLIPPFLIEEPATLAGEPDDAGRTAEKTTFVGMLLAIQPLWGFLIYDAYAMSLRLLGIEHEHYYAEIVCGVITVIFVMRALAARETPQHSARDHLIAFRQVLAANSFSWIGVQTMFVFIVIYLQSVLTHLSEIDVGRVNSTGLLVLSAVGAVLPVLVLEPLTEKIGRIRTHMASLAVMAAGYLGLYVVGDTVAAVYVLMAIVGVGWAAIVSLPFAIFSQKIDMEEMGLYMGLFNLSIVLPQLVVSLGISLFVSRAEDLSVIFLVSAIALAISTIAWSRVRED